MWLRRILKNMSGATMVYVAISIVILIGFTGLVIDGGRLYLARSQLQKAADAGALAGANVMLKDHQETSGFNYVAAEQMALELATDNYQGSAITYTPKTENDRVEITGQEMVPLYLMRVLGLEESNVTAVAQAKVGFVESADKGVVLPIGIHIPGFPENPESFSAETYNLILSPGESVSGNFGFLDFSQLGAGGPNGAKGVGYFIENGSPAALSVGQQLETETGGEVKSNVVSEPLNDREAQTLIIPIVTEFGSGTSEKVTILGFAAFELVDYDRSSHTITVQSLRSIIPGEMGDSTTGYGTYTVELIK